MKKPIWTLGAVLLILTVIVLLLCFYQFPSQDDHVGIYLKKTYGGLKGAISWYLREQNGRYATIPLFLTISSNSALMDHYGLLLLIFILFTGLSIFCFLRVLLLHLFGTRWPFGKVAALTIMVMFVYLTLVPEVSTFFYWLATSITYLFPFGIFLLLLCCYSFLLRPATNSRWGWTIAAGLLTFILAGCNEIMLYYTLALPFLAAFFLWGAGKKPPAALYLMALVGILACLLAMNMPGNGIRAYHFKQRNSFVTSMTNALLLTWDTFLPILSSPLFYISSYALFRVSAYLPTSTRSFFAGRRTHWLIDTVCIFLLVFCFYVAIRQVGNAEVPLRAVNILVCLSVTGLWWIVLTHASKVREMPAFLTLRKEYLPVVFTSVFTIALLGSVFVRQLINNAVEAPLHAHVMKQRIQQVREAKAAGQRMVQLAGYQKMVEQVVSQQFGLKKWFVMEKFHFPPSFSFFKDEPSSQRYACIYAEYYNIDSIRCENNTSARWSLIRKPR